VPLYFAYGSNLDVAAMAVRCPQSRVLGLGRLNRHRVIINTDGYATVLRDPRAVVLGLVYDLALADMPALDRYEGLARGLYTKISQPIVMEGGAKRALVYVGRSAEPGSPKPGYLEAIVAAARAAGLPEAYAAGLGGQGRRSKGALVSHQSETWKPPFEQR